MSRTQTYLAELYKKDTQEKGVQSSGGVGGGGARGTLGAFRHLLDFHGPLPHPQKDKKPGVRADHLLGNSSSGPLSP